MIGYIYKITNLINGKIYIGKRMSESFDNYYGGSGKILKLAYQKYEKENFLREVICGCETIEELNKQEIYGIKGYRDRDFICYNITDGGDGTGGYKHSKETKEKFSKIHKGQIPGNKGKKGNPSILLKFKLSHSGKKKPGMQSSVMCDGIEFSSVQECAKYLGLKDTKHMPRYLKNRKYKNHILFYIHKRGD